MVISEDVKNRIKDLYYNTRLSISRIYEVVFPKEECSKEEFYEMLDKILESNKRNVIKRKVIELLSEEELFDLRHNKKMSYKDIAEYYSKEKKLHIDQTDLALLCRKIYNEKGLEDVKLSTRRKKNIEDLYEDIFNLREKGCSLQEITEYCASKGKKVSTQILKDRLEKIYASKGKPVPETKRGKTKIKISLLELYKLRIDERFSYGIMEKYYLKKGVKISNFPLKKRVDIIEELIKKYDICNIQDFYRCLYKEKLLLDENDNLENLNSPEMQEKLEEFRVMQAINNSKRDHSDEILEENNADSEIINNKKEKTNKRQYIKWYEYSDKKDEDDNLNKNNEDILLEKPSYIDLFKLRGKGLSCKEIAQKFIEQKQPFSFQTINELCNEVNKSVVISRKINSKISKQDIYKRITRLKAKGKSYREIQKILKEKYNVDITHETVRKRAIKIVKESSQLIEALDEETVKKVLLKLKYTKNANYAQLHKLAKCYGFDIDFSKDEEYNEQDDDLEK